MIVPLSRRAYSLRLTSNWLLTVTIKIGSATTLPRAFIAGGQPGNCASAGSRMNISNTPCYAFLRRPANRKSASGGRNSARHATTPPRRRRRSRPVVHRAACAGIRLLNGLPLRCVATASWPTGKARGRIRRCHSPVPVCDPGARFLEPGRMRPFVRPARDHQVLALRRASAGRPLGGCW